MPWTGHDPVQRSAAMMLLECRLGQRYLTEANNDTDYAAWLVLADVHLIKTYGIGYRDLADRDWRAAYDSGAHPHEAAVTAVKSDARYSALAQDDVAGAAEVEVVLTAGARKTLDDASAYMQRLHERYGSNSEAVRAAEHSLLTCVLHLLSHGGYLIRDGDLSLMASTARGAQYSLTFRPTKPRRNPGGRRHALVPGTWTHTPINEHSP